MQLSNGKVRYELKTFSAQVPIFETFLGPGFCHGYRQAAIIGR